MPIELAGFSRSLPIQTLQFIAGSAWAAKLYWCLGQMSSDTRNSFPA